jgi:hypothetical protein
MAPAMVRVRSKPNAINVNPKTIPTRRPVHLTNVLNKRHSATTGQRIQGIRPKVIASAPVSSPYGRGSSAISRRPIIASVDCGTDLDAGEDLRFEIEQDRQSLRR